MSLNHLCDWNKSKGSITGYKKYSNAKLQIGLHYKQTLENKLQKFYITFYSKYNQ